MIYDEKTALKVKLQLFSILIDKVINTEIETKTGINLATTCNNGISVFPDDLSCISKLSHEQKQTIKKMKFTNINTFICFYFKIIFIVKHHKWI